MAAINSLANGDVAISHAKPATDETSNIPTTAEILARCVPKDGPLVVTEFENNEKKRKREKEPRELVRKRRKEEASERARANAAEKKQKAIEEGTFDYEAEERRKKERHVNSLVKRNIEKRLKAGEFGPILPHPNSGKGGPQKKFFDVSTGKMLSYKGEKYKREKNKRIAQRAEKLNVMRQLYPELVPPNLEDGYTEEQVEEYERQQKEKKRANRKAKQEKKEADAVQTEKEKEERLEAKRLRRQERLEQKARTAAGIAEMKARKAAEQAAQEATNQERWAKEAEVEAVEKAKRAAKKEAKRARQEGGVLLPVETDDANDFQTGADFVSLDASAPDPTNALFNALGGEVKPATTNGTSAASSSSTDEQGQNGSHTAPTAGLTADEIKLGVTKKGRVRKVPGVGRVDKYPSKAEKRQKKLESKAFEVGLTLEDYQAKLDREKWEAEAPERERIAKVQAERGGLNAKDYRKKIAKERDNAANAIYLATGTYPQPGTYDPAEVMNMADLTKWEAREVNWDDDEPMPDAVAVAEIKSELEPVDLNAISEKKRKQYAAKAEEKGMTLEDYIDRRNKKKAKLAGEPTEDAGPSTVHESMGFVVDTKGDSELHLAAPKSTSTGIQFVVDTIGNAALQNAKHGDKAAIRWHPDMQGDRQVRELSKEERKARLEWLRARRAARHAAAGRNPMSKKERHKKKMEKKMGIRNKLVYEILKGSGKPMDQKVSKEELQDARRQAKRQQRELKRIKRNKVIHRKNQKVVALISTGRV